MEIISSITRVHGKVRIIAGKETFLITRAAFEERPLHEGEALDVEAYDQWLFLRQYRPALDYAVSLLAQRAHATGELEQKLNRAGYRPATIEMVLYKLSSNHLTDDADFARQWAAARAKRLGPGRIAQELRRKGVSREDAQTALDELNQEDQLQTAVSLADKALRHAKPGEDPRKTAQRVLAMLARRGYGYDMARQALEIARENVDA